MYVGVFLDSVLFIDLFVYPDAIIIFLCCFSDRKYNMKAILHMETGSRMVVSRGLKGGRNRELLFNGFSFSFAS